jgi:FMN phosphatase YigB (HAD superfamily)
MTMAAPRRTVFVDDRLQNLNPAAALGVKTILFESAGQLRTSLQAHGLLA